MRLSSPPPSALCVAGGFLLQAKTPGRRPEYEFEGDTMPCGRGKKHRRVKVFHGRQSATILVTSINLVLPLFFYCKSFSICTAEAAGK